MGKKKRPSDDMPTEEKFEPDYSDLPEKSFDDNKPGYNNSYDRLECLRLATSIAGPGESGQDIVKRAEAFLAFMSGEQ